MRESNGSRKSDDAVVRRDENDLVGLCTEVRRGGITRRQFVERALVLGLSASAVGALAAACGGSSGTAAETETVQPMDESKPAEVTFYNWTDYLAPGITKDFKKATGIEVKESYFTANEELLAKMKAGSAGYDVIVPSDWMVSVMTKSSLLEPLDMKYLPNFQYVGKEFQNPIYDDTSVNNGLSTACPTSTARRATCAAPTRSSRRRPTGPRSSTRSTRARSTCSTTRARHRRGTLSLGLDPNTTDQAELDQATDKMIEQKPLVSAYDSANMKRAIVQGLFLTHCWDGDALMSIDALGGDAKATELVDFVRPTEGFYSWVDNMVVPVGNNSRYGAHLWMDYLMDPKVAGKNASWVWYLSAITPASWEYTDEFALSMRPSDEELARSVISVDVGEFQRRIRRGLAPDQERLNRDEEPGLTAKEGPVRR